MVKPNRTRPNEASVTPRPIIAERGGMARTLWDSVADMSRTAVAKRLDNCMRIARALAQEDGTIRKRAPQHGQNEQPYDI